MADESPTVIESRLRATLEELGSSASVKLVHQNVSAAVGMRGDEDFVVREVAEKTGTQVSDIMRRYFFRPDEIHAVWRSESASILVGEFCLFNLYRSFTREDFPPDDESLPPDQYETLSDLRIIDSAPYGGNGNVAGVHPESGDQVWFYDGAQHRLERLGVDYAGYIDALLVTKGTTGWQYLYADVRFDTALKRTGARLVEMLMAFPEAFPNHDYQPLRARLEARL